MQNPGTNPFVNPGSKRRACQRSNHHGEPVADESDERTWACTGQIPAEAKDRTAGQIANTAAQCLGRSLDGFAGDGPKSKTLEQRERDARRDYR